MRSTQFEDHLPYEEGPEGHRRRNQPDKVTINPSYGRNSEVRLYDGPKEAIGLSHEQLASAPSKVVRRSRNTSGSARRTKRFEAGLNET
jgi:hypothetical protein